MCTCQQEPASHHRLSSLLLLVKNDSKATKTQRRTSLQYLAELFSKFRQEARAQGSRHCATASCFGNVYAALDNTLSAKAVKCTAPSSSDRMFGLVGSSKLPSRALKRPTINGKSRRIGSGVLAGKVDIMAAYGASYFPWCCQVWCTSKQAGHSC